MMQYLLIFIGGGLGSLSRFGIGKLTAGVTAFPLGTLLANVISTFLIGLFIGVSGNNQSSMLRYFFAIGFCGGFSTFSAFSAETFELLRSGNYSTAFINIVLNLLLCLVGVWLGFILVKK